MCGDHTSLTAVNILTGLCWMNWRFFLGFFFLSIKEGCLSLMKTVSLVELNWFRGRYMCIFVSIGTFMDNWEVIETY